MHFLKWLLVPPLSVTTEYKGVSDLARDAYVAFVSTTCAVIVSLELAERVAPQPKYDWIAVAIGIYTIIFFSVRAIWSFVILFMKIYDRRVKDKATYTDLSRLP